MSQTTPKNAAKSKANTLSVGTMTHLGRITQVRRSKKYPRRYRVGADTWYARHELRVFGVGDKRE